MKVITDALGHWLTAPLLLRPLFALLRDCAPILVLRDKVVISRYVDVLEVLSRPDDFTVAEINAANINRHDGPFILGMDPSPQYSREVGLLRKAVRADDLELIRQLVRQNANELIDHTWPAGRIDVVNGFARTGAVRLVKEYFGVPFPDDSEHRLMEWLRDIFHDVFLNFTNDQEIRQTALHSSAALRKHLDDEIARRQHRQLAPPTSTDVLGRLIDLKQTHDWLDSDTVRRNLSGLIVGAVETTSKFITLALDELLRRPDTLRSARQAAIENNVEAVRRYAFEAARFNPHTPFFLRFCGRETTLAEGTLRARKIQAGSTVLVSTLSAMFDPDGFPAPKQFRLDRQSEYLHFGHGMHRCFGFYINGVQVPELMAALLRRLPNLRRAQGRDGRIDYAGPFPNKLLVEFDRTT